MGEWIEIFNREPVPLDIRGMQIVDQGGAPHTIQSESPVLVPSGGYFVLGLNTNQATNGGAPIGYQYDGIFLSNVSDTLEILAFGTSLDAVAWDSTFMGAGASKELTLFLIKFNPKYLIILFVKLSNMNCMISIVR